MNLATILVCLVLAALIAGAALSVSGLVMQTTLSNAMASPSTMGVSNAAVFGANLSIIVFAGGFLSTGNNLASYTAGVNPFAASVTAFLFSALSILLILALCRVKAFSPNVVVLAGIAVGAIATLVPEVEIDFEKDLIERIKFAQQTGKRHFIVVVAEGVGKTEEICKRIQEATGIESRATILGHVQRGGSPTCLLYTSDAADE